MLKELIDFLLVKTSHQEYTMSAPVTQTTASAINYYSADPFAPTPSDSTRLPVTTAQATAATELSVDRVIQVGYLSMFNDGVTPVDTLYGMTYSGVSASDPAGINTGSIQPIVVWRHSTANYPSINGMSPKFKLRILVTHNAEATLPGFTVACGIYEVTPGATGNTGSGGGGGIKTYAMNTLVTPDGVTPFQVSVQPSTSSLNVGTTGSSFDLGNNWYGFGVTQTGLVQDAHMHIKAELLLSYAEAIQQQ